MASYRFLVQQISGYFEGCEFLHVPRADNDQADALARIGSTRQAIPTGVSLQRLLKPSIKPSPESDSIFVPPAPETAESGSRNPAGGTKMESDSRDGLIDGLRRRCRATPVGIACRVEPIRARASAGSLSAHST